MLGRIIVPEWILGGERTSTRCARASTADGEPWAAFEDNYWGGDAEDFLDAWSELEAREMPCLVGVDASWLEVEVVNSLNALNQLSCEFIGDEDSWVDVGVSVIQVVQSFWNNAASVCSNRALILPVVSWVNSCELSINGGCRSSNQAIDDGVPHVYLAAELVSAL